MLSLCNVLPWAASWSHDRWLDLIMTAFYILMMNWLVTKLRDMGNENACEMKRNDNFDLILHFIVYVVLLLMNFVILPEYSTEQYSLWHCTLLLMQHHCSIQLTLHASLVMQKMCCLIIVDCHCSWFAACRDTHMKCLYWSTILLTKGSC